MAFQTKLINIFILFLFPVFLLQSCDTSENKADPAAISVSPSEDLTIKPNILWIVAEDMSEYIPSFGDSTVVTPNLSRLAAEGICYDNFYAPHPVCAPAELLSLPECMPIA